MTNSFETLWTVACQAPLSMEFPRQQHWSGLPFPSPGDLPDPRIEPMSPALVSGFFTTEPSGKAHLLFQFNSVSQPHPTLCNPMDCGTPGFPVHHQLPELAQTHVHRVGDAISHLTLCRPLLLLPSVFPIIRVFSSESVLHIMSFSLSISPSSEYSGWISLRFNWFDLPTVQGTLRSLLQHHS